MDALALLCNLHADGPDSLLQLREAGCDRIELLAALDTDELAGVLELSPTASKRFLAEARLLAERLTGAPLEDIDANHVDAACAAPAADSLDDDDHGPYPAPERRPAPDRLPLVSRDALDELEEAFEEGGSDAELEFPRRGERARSTGEPISDAVLQAWRELDAEDPAGSEPETVLVPHRPPASPAPPATPLTSVELGALTDEVRRALVDAGLTTLEDLMERDAVELAQASGVPVTRVLRLQFLARRLAAPSPEEPASEPRPAPHEPAGGPFA